MTVAGVQFSRWICICLRLFASEVFSQGSISTEAQSNAADVEGQKCVY